MPVDKDDESWIGPLLSQHADRRELDLDAFVTRVVAEAHATPADRTGRDRSRRWTAPPRRRLRPALVAAGSAFAVVVAAVGVSALVHSGTPDDRASVVRSASPEPSSGRTVVPQPITPRPSAAPSTKTSSAPDTSDGRGLPSSFQWRSGAPVFSPRTDAGGVTGFRDPSVVYAGGRWHMFVTTAGPSGYGLGYLNFRDWSQANAAPVHNLASSPIGAGFREAPQVFYFAPQKLWYLVYLSGHPSYSTNPDLANPNGWSAPKDFYAGVPDLIQKNLTGGYWIDPWVICDQATCYLFSSDNRGHLFRSQTAKAAFPGGMSQPVIAAQDSGQGTTFGASRVYQIGGTGRYLLSSQAFGPDGHAYQRSWTAPGITGPWTALADTPTTPFAGATDVTFPGGSWTSDVVRGELIRDGVDQSLTIDPCQLRLVYLGLDRRFQDNRTFQIGLLTQTNSGCR